MTFQDIFYVFGWWAVWFLLGTAFLPLATLIFANFFDRGYIFAKILGALLLSYAVWLLGSLHILPLGGISLFLIWLIFISLNSILAYFLHRKKDSRRPLVSWNFKIFILEEVIFLLGFIFWAFVKAHEPSIHGLEKYMDYGFMHSILRSEFFPPKDLWMSPLSINYYYFGHLVTAVVMKISGINPDVGYNLMLATIFSLTLSASFSIGANLYYKYSILKTKYLMLAGLLSSLLVTLGGNLHTIYAFFQNYPTPENPIPFWQLHLHFNFSGYWYPNATRFIPNTIHEFPIYSFVVSDLHGHVLNIPFVLLAIALLIKIFHQGRIVLGEYLLLGLLLATFLMTNVLDGPIYLLVILVILFAMYRRIAGSAIFHTIKDVSIILLAGFFLSLPFWLNFAPFAQGIGVICAPSFLTDLGRVGPFLFEANHCTRSPLWMLIILWGFPFFVFFGFLIFILDIKKFIGHWKLKIENLTDILILTLVFVSTILILIPEFFYAKDIYPAHWRANTVFKFGYQAFIILGLTCGYMITRLLTQTKKFLPYFFILAALFFLVAIYPYFAIKSYYNGLKNYQGLDGFKYLQNLYPSDYKAILWLRENIQGPTEGPSPRHDASEAPASPKSTRGVQRGERQGRQPVILEAQGDSYTDYARVSANSGLPTIIGWPVHEWLWRGSYDEAGKRGGEVTTLYESPDVSITQSLIQKYNISYVFIGALERQKYLNLNEQKFQSLGKLIFADDTTRIYQINK